MERYDDAVSEYKKSISIFPEFAHYNLGMIFMKGKKYRKAAFHFREVVRIQPDDSEALQKLKYVLHKISGPK